MHELPGKEVKMSVLKDKIRMLFFDAAYFLHRTGMIRNPLHVKSIDETIDKLINTNKSLVRFGDAEIRMIEGNTTKFQDYEGELAKRLYEILQYEQENVMVGIPDIFDSLEDYTDKSKAFWKMHLFFSRRTYLRYCNIRKEYENAFFSRLYYIYKDKERSGRWFERIKEIWRDKEVVIVEGEGTHTGVGNDLLDTAAGIERILCPVLNAYHYYNEIRQACFRMCKDKLFLLAVGNTAKLLVSDLAREGYRALDIGNLDLEYEWFLRRAADKIEIRKNSVMGKTADEQAGYHEFLLQVKERIQTHCAEP